MEKYEINEGKSIEIGAISNASLWPFKSALNKVVEKWRRSLNSLRYISLREALNGKVQSSKRAAGSKANDGRY